MNTFKPSTTISILCVFFAIACNKIKPEPPLRSQLDSALYVPESVLNIPIKYDVARLQHWINRKITGTFVNQGININESGDSLYLVVTKLSAIKMRWYRGILHYEIPLAMEGTYYKKFGNMFIHNPDPVKAEMIIKISSWIDVDQAWNLKTTSELREIVWIKEPRVKLGPINLNLTKQIDRILHDKQGMLIKLMDDAVYENLDLEKVISKLWSDIQKPIFLHRNEPQVYLKHRASSVNGNLVRTNSKEIILDLTLRTKALAAMDEAILPETNNVLPSFEANKNPEEGFNIAILGVLSYKKINKEIRKYLKGKEVEVKGYKSTIKEVEVYGSDQSLVVKLDVKGDIRGRLYMLGELQFDPEAGLFRINNFRYDFDTQDQLVKTAEPFLRDMIIEEVQKLLHYDISHLLDQLPELISKAIDEGKSGNAISLFIDELNVVGWNSLITKDNIQFVVQAKGKASLQIEELKSGKSLQIGMID